MRKILIIDDEEDLTFFLKANIELNEGYEVRVATNGKEGVKLAARYGPDVILLDIMMPRMDGYEVLRRLKKSIKTLAIPVIMLTAKGDDESKMKAAGLYDEDYIVKPVQIVPLLAKVDEVLQRGGLTD